MDNFQDESQDQSNAAQVSEAPGAEEQEAAAAARPEPGIKEVKGEMTRKMSNLEAQLADTQRLLQELASRGSQAPQPAQPAKPLKDLMYDDPDQFASVIESRVASAVSKKVDAQSATAAEVSRIASQYPEFQDASSEAYRLALRKAGALNESFRQTPEGVRAAMLDAALELGLVPAMKRTQKIQGAATDADEFSVGSSTGRKPAASSSQGSKKDDLNPKTRDFAALIGLDVNNPKVVENLKKHSKRKWSRDE
jgi:hypothetical protein